MRPTLFLNAFAAMLCGMVAIANFHHHPAMVAVNFFLSGLNAGWFLHGVVEMLDERGQ
jgi:hypothetical protein